MPTVCFCLTDILSYLYAEFTVFDILFFKIVYKNLRIKIPRNCIWLHFHLPLMAPHLIIIPISKPFNFWRVITLQNKFDLLIRRVVTLPGGTFSDRRRGSGLYFSLLDDAEWSRNIIFAEIKSLITDYTPQILHDLSKPNTFESQT